MESKINAFINKEFRAFGVEQKSEDTGYLFSPSSPASVGRVGMEKS